MSWLSRRYRNIECSYVRNYWALAETKSTSTLSSISESFRQFAVAHFERLKFWKLHLMSLLGLWLGSVSYPIHCKHLSLIESTTARVIIIKLLTQYRPLSYSCTVSIIMAVTIKSRNCQLHQCYGQLQIFTG